MKSVTTGVSAIILMTMMMMMLMGADAFTTPRSPMTLLPNAAHFQRIHGSRSVRTHKGTYFMSMKEVGEKSSPEWLQNGVSKCRKVMSRTRLAIRRIANWQKKRGSSLVTAAAFALSVLFCSQQTLDSYVQPLSSSSSSQTEVHTVGCRGEPQSSYVPLSTRGGQNLARTKNTYQKPKSSYSSTSENNVAILQTEKMVEDAIIMTEKTLGEAFQDLSAFMKGPKSDTLLLLLATSLITPICKKMGISPILGFLSSGMLLGPNGWGLISGIHTTETLAELGIVFFLFEMGIELSVERLINMKKDVFGLGLSQFILTAGAMALAGSTLGLPANALVVLGGGLALSSSAFVLQLLKDKNQLATRFGKASFGILLFQDLAVVPLLVVTPILAGSGTGLAAALGSAVLKGFIALGSIAVVGRYLLNPMFRLVAAAQSQEAFLGVILLTVLSMSFMTEGLGLSNTLGAFLAGVLLSETRYRYQVEADIAPFRGVLLGLFFVTVGFEIDVHLILSKFPQVISIVVGIIGIKAAVATGLSLLFGLSLSTSQQTGLIISQGGEFAFVAFGLARSLGIFDIATTKLLLTSVSLTMALTPALASLGGRIAKRLEEKSDFTHYLGQDSDAIEIKESDDFAVVVGYGVVGKVVCDLLDRKFIRYVGLEIDPNKAIQARNQGLPVFYGDVGRPEVAEAFNIGKAKAVILCISDKQQANRAAIAIRRLYPTMKIFSRAVDADHAGRLQKTLDVIAMVPILPEDNLLMTLPFGGAVLKSLGVAEEAVNAILESKRKEVLSGRGLRDSEEEATLLQLGILVNKAEPDKAVIDVTVSKVSNTTVTASSSPAASTQTPSQVAAAAVLDEIEARSPILASVIEANCPGATSDDKDDDSPATNGELVIPADRNATEPVAKN